MCLLIDLSNAGGAGGFLVVTSSYGLVAGCTSGFKLPVVATKLFRADDVRRLAPPLDDDCLSADLLKKPQTDSFKRFLVPAVSVLVIGAALGNSPIVLTSAPDKVMVSSDMIKIYTKVW